MYNQRWAKLDMSAIMSISEYANTKSLFGIYILCHSHLSFTTSIMIFSGPKFEGPNIDYLSWLLARRSYKDDSELFVDAQDASNAISYGELVDLTKRIGQVLRELGVGAI